jgi:hypothetical protein
MLATPEEVLEGLEVNEATRGYKWERKSGSMRNRHLRI